MIGKQINMNIYNFNCDKNCPLQYIIYPIFSVIKQDYITVMAWSLSFNSSASSIMTLKRTKTHSSVLDTFTNTFTALHDYILPAWSLINKMTCAEWMWIQLRDRKAIWANWRWWWGSQQSRVALFLTAMPGIAWVVALTYTHGLQK